MTRRVLMTVDAVGGVWSYALELARALVPLGHEVALALLGPAPDDTRRAEVAALAGVTLIETGLPLDWLAEDAAAVAAAGREVAALAARWGADIVQLNQPALAAEAAFDRPTVIVVHSCVATWWDAVYGTALPPDLAWQARLTESGLRRADAVACPSASFAAAVQARYALPAAPEVVHNGRTPLGGATGALHDFALTVGRLWDEGKNLATLDRAAARLGVPVRAIGPLEAPDGKRVTLEHVHPLGTRDPQALAQVLAARPVFVSTAKYEPFGLAVLEAALAGCPLVLADIPTFRELWDGIALFVDPDDAAAVAQAIEALIGDVPARLARGDLARRHAARYTPERMAQGMAALYARLPTAPARRAAA